MPKCPICKNRLEVKDYCSENYVEYYEVCKNGCKNFSYESWCGNHKTFLGGAVFYEHYNDSKTKSRNTMFIYKKKLAKLRKSYKNGDLDIK